MRKYSIRIKNKLNEKVYNLILPQLFDLIEKAFRRSKFSKLFHKLARVKIIIKVIGNFETYS